MKSIQAGVQGAILSETVEMIGKATTMTVREMDQEKKNQLGKAMERVVHGNSRERGEAVLDGFKQTYGLSIAKGVERADQALAEVRHDAESSRAYAIAKGVVNVPAQIVRGITVDTAIEVTKSVTAKMQGALPDLQSQGKESRGRGVHERSHDHSRS